MGLVVVLIAFFASYSSIDERDKSRGQAFWRKGEGLTFGVSKVGLRVVKRYRGATLREVSVALAKTKPCVVPPTVEKKAPIGWVASVK